MPDPRLLLVDDEQPVRRMLCRVLERRGFDVVAEADNGQTGVAAARQHQPDIVIMDLNMPLMNGIEATRAIKQTHPAIEVLIFSAYADESLRSSAEEAGAAGWILKGSKPQELFDALAALAAPVALPGVTT